MKAMLHIGTPKEDRKASETLCGLTVEDLDKPGIPYATCIVPWTTWIAKKGFWKNRYHFGYNRTFPKVHPGNPTGDNASPCKTCSERQAKIK